MTMINIAQNANSFSAQQRYNVVKSLAQLDKANNELGFKQYKGKIIPKYRSRFAQTMAMLTPISSMIIENEFNNKNTKDWYDKHFSKTTYYKNRKKAIEEFLYFYLNQ
ncbi:MG284/MPN403 family protein [Mycoplasma simbae]|uniref:MG284/MPN403 family protein n=1 Tax=Mycoplasma simbae TaxID=36744 RepID=UPI0004952E87|nr:hypothetical protein [Mycoplasma simbae]